MKRYLPFITMLFLSFGATACILDDECGDGVKGETEECDDGNLNNGDGCSSLCKVETSVTPTPTPTAPVCGNGVLESGEECDDGNQINGDGCSSSCKKESTSTPTPTSPVCGNGVLESGEECDDGNKNNGDGCSSSCKKEQTTQTPESKCPKDGDSCTGDDSLCCDNNIYDCIDGQYEVTVCGSGTYCDSVGSYHDCAESCSSQDAAYDFIDYDICEDGEFELFSCEKGASGKYGIFGGNFAISYCWDENILLSCKSNGQEPEEITCAEMCVEKDYKDSFADYCAE